MFIDNFFTSCNRNYPEIKDIIGCENGCDQTRICSATYGPDWSYFNPNDQYRLGKCAKTSWDSGKNNEILRDCCFGDVNDIKICDPKWCRGTDVCDTYLFDYNEENKEKYLDYFCPMGLETNNPVCEKFLFNYCTKNFNDNICKNFCSNNSKNPDSLGYKWCHKHIQDHCNGDELHKESGCYTLCNNEPGYKGACSLNINNHCNTLINLSSPECNQFCFNSSDTENKYNCDVTLINLCKDWYQKNPDIEYPNIKIPEVCSCALPSEFYAKYYRIRDDPITKNYPQLIGIINTLEKRPQCSYGPCSTGHALLRNQDKTVCGNVQLCIDLINAKNTGGNLSIGEINQICENIMNISNNPPITPPGSPNSPFQSPSNPNQNPINQSTQNNFITFIQNYWKILIPVIIILFIVIILLIKFLMKK